VKVGDSPCKDLLKRGRPKKPEPKPVPKVPKSMPRKRVKKESAKSMCSNEQKIKITQVKLLDEKQEISEQESSDFQ
jgi:hypothetical protein